MKTYIIEGGIGKAVAFTALIPELAKEEKIQVYTPYADVFVNNPGVELVFDSGNVSVHDPRIIKSDRIYREVYKGNFINGNMHLIEAMCHEYGIEYNPNMKPELFTDRYVEPQEDYCIIQLSGGQPAVTGDWETEYQPLDASRNLHPICAQNLVNGIKERWPALRIINFTLPNEPVLDNTERELRPFAWYHEALKNAKFHVSIDSCLNHFSGSTETPGLVLWGNTKSKQFGYNNNVNLEFSQPNYIDTEVVIHNLEKFILDEWKP